MGLNYPTTNPQAAVQGAMMPQFQQLMGNMFPSREKRTSDLNRDYANEILGLTRVGSIFQVGAGNKLGLHPDFKANFPSYDEAWNNYSNQALAKRVVPDRMKFDELYELSSQRYREGLTKSLSSASVNYDQKDIQKVIASNPGLLKYVMSEGPIDPALAPFVPQIKRDKKGFAALPAIGMGLGGNLLGMGIFSAWGNRSKGLKGALSAGMKELNPLTQLRRASVAVQSLKPMALRSLPAIGEGTSPKIARAVAGKLNFVNKTSDTAFRQIQIYVKKHGVKGLWKKLVGKVGRTKAALYFGKLGLGAAGFVGPQAAEPITTFLGLALTAHTAYEVANLLKDVMTDSKGVQLPEGTEL